MTRPAGENREPSTTSGAIAVVNLHLACVAWPMRGPQGAIRPAGMTMSRFWTLPVAPLGNASTSHRCRGYL
jgi:hypothetical protein